MYIIYNDAGDIIGTISGPGKEYGSEILDKQNKKWIFLEGGMNINPLTSYVDPATKQVRENEPISLVVDKAKFFADGADFATITGIPLGASVTIYCNDQPYGPQHIAHDTSLEFATDQVAEYRINVSCTRYIATSLTLQSIEPPAITSTNIATVSGVAMSIPDFSKEI